MKTSYLSIRIEPEFLKQINEEAKKQGRTIGGLIRFILREYFKRRHL
jgi:hypothetical protein